MGTRLNIIILLIVGQLVVVGQNLDAKVNIFGSFTTGTAASIHEESEYLEKYRSDGFKRQGIGSGYGGGIEYEGNLSYEDFAYSVGVMINRKESYVKRSYVFYANILYYTDPKFYILGGMNYAYGHNFTQSFDDKLSEDAKERVRTLEDVSPSIGFQFGMGYFVFENLSVELVYELLNFHLDSSIEKLDDKVRNFDYDASGFSSRGLRLSMKYSFPSIL